MKYYLFKRKKQNEMKKKTDLKWKMFGAKLTDYVVTFLLVFLACQRRNFSKIELQRLFPYDSSVVIVKISSNEKMWWKIKKKEKKKNLKI